LDPYLINIISLFRMATKPFDSSGKSPGAGWYLEDKETGKQVTRAMAKRAKNTGLYKANSGMNVDAVSALHWVKGVNINKSRKATPPPPASKKGAKTKKVDRRVSSATKVARRQAATRRKQFHEFRMSHLRMKAPKTKRLSAKEKKIEAFTKKAAKAQSLVSRRLKKGSSGTRVIQRQRRQRDINAMLRRRLQNLVLPTKRRGLTQADYNAYMVMKAEQEKERAAQNAERQAEELRAQANALNQQATLAREASKVLRDEYGTPVIEAEQLSPIVEESQYREPISPNIMSELATRLGRL
jgi:hypothetical protein